MSNPDPHRHFGSARLLAAVTLTLLLQGAACPAARAQADSLESASDSESATAALATTGSSGSARPDDDDDDGFLSGVARGAKRLGGKAGRLLRNVAGDIGDTARRAGRGAERSARTLMGRLSHRASDLNDPKKPANLALVIPGTDLGVRVLKQIDKWGHYDPVWAHSPQFIASIAKRWPDSQVKLFTWLSGPDPITIDAAANGLHHFLARWRAEHPGKKIRIYAHSNGGNVALHAAARYQPTTAAALFADELITAGTPLRPDDAMSTRFGAIRRLVFVFTRHDWVAGDVRDPVPSRDPRQGIVPKILRSGYTPELAVRAKLTRGQPILSTDPYQYVVSLDGSPTTSATYDEVLLKTYGQDFLERRQNDSIGEVDASAIVCGHSDYNRPEVNVAILDLVARYDRGETPVARPATPVSTATPAAASR